MSTETTQLTPGKTIPLVTRPTNSGRIGTDIPYQKPSTHYYWASDNRVNPQSVWAKKTVGYRLVDSSEAETLGLDGYQDAPNIRYGDLLLMECTEAQFEYNQSHKRTQFDAIEGTSRDKAAENIDSVRSAYERQKRG